MGNKYTDQNRNSCFDNLSLPHQLRKYQLDGIKFLIQNQIALLADEMGLGKTVQVAVALEILYRQNRIWRTLIVVPSSLKLNWQKEIKKWAPSLSVQRIIGGGKNRWAYFHLPYNVLIASYEDIQIEFGNSNIMEKYELVVLDEAQRIKNPNSNTALACKLINRNSSWALTGTPIENSIEDLISIFSFLKLGLIYKGMLKKEIHKRIKMNFLRRKKKEVLKDMPPIIEQELPLELSGQQKRAYESYIFFKRSYYHQKSITHGELLSLITKLKQLCNYDPESNISVKLDALKTLINDVVNSDNKLIVFSQYLETLKWIANNLTEINYMLFSGELSENEKNKVLKDFEEESGPIVLLMSLKAGGVGLNIQAADSVLLFDRWWNPAVERQAIHRAHRFGRTRPLHVIKFVIVNSIEEEILNIIQKKESLFRDYVDKAEGFPVSQFKEEILHYLSKQVS